MGCFSFLCQECGKPGNSTSFRGDRVRLYLLKDGEVIDYMSGEYDSYGRVFDDEKKWINNELRASIKWKIGWSAVCDLIHDDDKPDHGMALIHESCFTWNIPVEGSERDPDQGWGEVGAHLN